MGSAQLPEQQQPEQQPEQLVEQQQQQQRRRQRGASGGGQLRAELRIGVSDGGSALVALATEVAAARATLLSYRVVPCAASDGHGHGGVDDNSARVWAEATVDLACLSDLEALLCALRNVPQVDTVEEVPTPERVRTRNESTL